MTWDSMQALVQLLGVPAAVAALILVFGSQGRWVFGRFYDQALHDLAREREEKERWRRVAERALQLSERLSPGAERTP